MAVVGRGEQARVEPNAVNLRDKSCPCYLCGFPVGPEGISALAGYRWGIRMNACPWENYRIQKNNRAPFSEVYHNCHISDALRIIEDGYIVSSLIWDESCLNNTRTLVSWVSPNAWAHGSIYGHISFVFDWETLSRNKRFYWVESITSYNPSAYRIMLTDRNLVTSQVSNMIVEFDPFTEGGPISKQNKVWYWNGNFTGEFMIDSSINLNDLKRIDIVDHHQRCKKNERTCKDKALRNKYEAGSILLASVIGRRLRKVHPHFLEKENNGYKFHYHCLHSLRWLAQALAPSKNVGFNGLDGDKAMSIVTAALLLYGNRRDSELSIIKELLGSKKIFFEAFVKVLKQYFSPEEIDLGIKELEEQISVYCGKNQKNC